MRKTLLAAWVATLGLWACSPVLENRNKIHDSLFGLIAEDPNNPAITYWDEDSWVQSWEYIECERQHIFDKTTGEPMDFLPIAVIEHWKQAWDESITVCKDDWRKDI